jgi:hypothetical protein
LWLIGELRRWFKEHEDISGERLYSLLRNVRGPGSGHFTHAYELLERRVIDFAHERSRTKYDLLKDAGTFMAQIEAHDTFVWTYPTR